ncbi:helix-turn-helix domain-containing protein [Pseudonocardia xinjiangensis]|uniref:helix-turn-helix domain-containing protein n=1 Tax=Pseudonocardia xinjiangensis TaxID=75289 RepID=UPI003D92995D
MPGRLPATSELAKRLRVSSRTIQRWRNEGWIKPEWTTIGGQARWIEEDVREQVRQYQEQIEAEQDGG